MVVGRFCSRSTPAATKSLKFLQQMVSIPSVTGDEGKIQKFLAEYLGKMGLEIDMWESDWEQLKKHPGYIPVDRGYEGRPNIVATWKGTGGGRSLMFNGHTDVIPVGKGEGWSDNPWSASIKDGKLYGRGSCDMKSGVASHIMAIENLMAAGAETEGRCLPRHRHRRRSQRPRHARHGDSRLLGRRRHFRRDQRTRGAAGVHWTHLVRDRNPGQGGRHPAALPGRKRYRTRL